MDDQEAKESAKDCTYYRSVSQVCDGFGDSCYIDYGNLSPKTKDTWFTGSPHGTWSAPKSRERNGHRHSMDLSYDSEDARETEQGSLSRSLDESWGNVDQSQNWYLDHRNVNYDHEDAKESHFYYRNVSNAYYAPYSNGHSVDVSELNGVSKGKEFVHYYEGDGNVCQNDSICPKAKTPAVYQSRSDTENKGQEPLFADPECKLQNYRGTDSLYQRRDMERNDPDERRVMALGHSRLNQDGGQKQSPRRGPGEQHGDVCQGPSLGKNTWHEEGERKLNGTDTWKRNSCFRRTAPSSLRRSEFVQNKRRSQGRDSDNLLRRLQHELG